MGSFYQTVDPITFTMASPHTCYNIILVSNKNLWDTLESRSFIEGFNGVRDYLYHLTHTVVGFVGSERMLLNLCGQILTFFKNKNWTIDIIVTIDKPLPKLPECELKNVNNSIETLEYLINNHQGDVKNEREILIKHKIELKKNQSDVKKSQTKLKRLQGKQTCKLKKAAK